LGDRPAAGAAFAAPISTHNRSEPNAYRHAGNYAGRILKGEAAGDASHEVRIRDQFEDGEDARPRCAVGTVRRTCFKMMAMAFQVARGYCTDEVRTRHNLPAAELQALP